MHDKVNSNAIDKRMQERIFNRDFDQKEIKKIFVVSIKEIEELCDCLEDNVHMQQTIIKTNTDHALLLSGLNWVSTTVNQRGNEGITQHGKEIWVLYITL